MVNHGISTGALFLLVGVIYDRRHTRDLAEFGGLAKVMPWYAAMFVLVTMSSIGLPGTNGFVGEFLIITGTFSAGLLRWSYHCTSGGDCDLAQVGPVFAAIAPRGVILGAIYMLDVTQKVFFGPNRNPKNAHLPDLSPREWAGLLPLVAMIFALGLFPNYFKSTASTRRCGPSSRCTRPRWRPCATRRAHARGLSSSTSPCSVLRGLPGPGLRPRRRAVLSFWRRETDS
jgi:NADH-quinone oxidoreductase subunit M